MKTEAKANQEQYNDMRKRYMDGVITYADFYSWLAGFIGATEKHLPVSQEQVAKSADPFLNDIPLKLWDKQDFIIRRLAYAKYIAWSLSDTVSVLKTLARKYQRDQTKTEAPSIYDQLTASGVPLDHHESDLYAKVTPVSQAIIRAYKFHGNVTTFINQVDRQRWYDIPFAYAPFWVKGGNV